MLNSRRAIQGPQWRKGGEMLIRFLSACFVVACVASCLHAVPAKAQSEMEDLRTYCKSDIERLCPGIEPGGGRVMKCLKANKKEMTVGCAQALQKLKGKMQLAFARPEGGGVPPLQQVSCVRPGWLSPGFWAQRFAPATGRRARACLHRKLSHRGRPAMSPPRRRRSAQRSEARQKQSK
jgi:Cysteine rich repeat